MMSFKDMKDELSPSEKTVEELKKAVQEERMRKKSPLKPLIAVAACAAVIVATAAVLPHLNTNVPSQETLISPGATTPASVQETVVDTENSIVLPWEQMSMTERYGGVTVNKTEYYFSGAQNRTDASLVGEKFADVTASGFDVYTDKTYTVNCEVYKISGVTPEVALAVKFEGNEEFYPCKADNYKPATLGQLIDDLNLREYLSFGTVYPHKMVGTIGSLDKGYALSDSSVIWDMLLYDTESVISGEENRGLELLDISISSDVLGIDNLGISLNADGYVQTNLCNTLMCFYVGSERIEEFIAYVKANGAVVEDFNDNANYVGEQTSNEMYYQETAPESATLTAAAYEPQTVVEITSEAYSPE